MQRVRKTGRPCILEHVYRDEHGNVLQYAEIRAYPVVDSKGDVVQVITSVIDVTERRRVEEALGASKSEYRSLFQDLPVGIALVTFGGQILHVNAAMSRLTGFAGSQLQRVNMQELFRKWQAMEPIWQRLRKEKGFAHDAEAGLVRKDGTLLDARVTLCRFTADGRAVILMSVTDISRRKKMEEDLEKTRDALARQQRSLRQKNIALTELVDQIQIEKDLLKEDIGANIRELVLPVVEKLRLSGAQGEYLDLLERRLHSVADRFGVKISQVTPRLSPREVELCTMIQSGLTTKEIAGLLGISYQTVEKHRRNIRKKTGLSGTKTNLFSYLQSEVVQG